jgi:hypothetical protein
MTHRTMRRLSLLFFFAAILASASVANAQTAYVNITEVRITPPGASESKKKPIATPVFINNQECQGTFKFKLSRIATTVSVMEAWVTTGGGAASRCTEPGARSRINNNDPTCYFAGRASGVTGEYEFTVPGPHIFGSRLVAPDARTCPADAFEQVFTIYFVPLASSSESTGSMAPPAIPGVLQPYATFTLFTKQPAPPNEVRARDGNRELRVSWERTDINPRTNYRAYFDFGEPAAGRMCGSFFEGGVPAGAGDASVSDAGAVADAGIGGMDAGSDDIDGAVEAGDSDESDDDDDTAAPGRISAPTGDLPATVRVATTDTNADNVALRNIEEIPFGRSVEVRVATIDPTGNVGYLSEPQCVQRVMTADLIDLCAMNPKECGLESCALSPGRSGSALWSALFALVLAALIRRRRSA